MFPEGLLCGDRHGYAIQIHLTEKIRDSWFNLRLDPKTSKWNWSVAASTSFGEINLSGSRDERGMQKLRHDLVAMALGAARTDVKLREVFRGLEITEGYEHYTPDIHVKVGNTDFFIEIGTTLSTDCRAGLDMLRQKRGKYMMALEEVKLQNPCILIVIVVGRTFCVSNYPLDQDVMEKLVYYMQLGHRFEEIVDMSGIALIMSPTDTNQKLMALTLEKSVASVKLIEDDKHWDFPLDITNKFISALSTPADEGLVQDYFIMSVRDSLTNMITSVKNPNTGDGDMRVEEYIKILTIQEGRDTMKPVAGFPLANVRRQDRFNMKAVPRYITDDRSGDPVIKLWNGAFKGYKNYELDFEQKTLQQEEEAYYTNWEDQEYVEKRNKDLRNLSHRCDIRGILTEKDRELLALDGLWGKRFKNSQAKMVKERFAKLPFKWSTDISDIDGFLLNSDLLNGSEFPWVDNLPLNLIRDSFTRLNQDKTVLNWAEDWTRTDLYCALEFISDLATEIAVSMKQNVKANEVILKKLGFYNAYLLILPTKSSEHIFYSIYIPKTEDVKILANAPFRELIGLEGGGYYTDFCSMRADTLANPCTISATFLGLVSYWCYHYRMYDFTPDTFVKNLNAVAMLNFSLLVRLENKAKTEEAITLSRYMYMEIFKSGTLIKPDPFRLISKFNTNPRSRLELFVIKRLISAFTIMLKSPPHKIVPPEEDYPDEAEEEIRNNDLWAGLINPYTGGTEVSASRVVNLFYLGYAVDKDKIAQANSDYATIQKAIKKDREFCMEEASRSNGQEDNFTDFPKEKQFSINAMKHGVELMAKELASRHGTTWKAKMGELVIAEMCEKMTEEVATLKASSSEKCAKWDQLAPAHDAVLTKVQRTKVITALLENLELFEHNVFKKFPELVRLIEESSEGVLSDLFKKNQHGGLREIYVLNIHSRIVALFLETASRVLCRQFECETMTHPNYKLEVIESHKIAVATRALKTNREFSEFHCSADKKSWNNNLVMPALSTALLKLLPSSFHGAIQRCLNMWNRRVLKIPDGVLKLLVDGTQLSCETYQAMLFEYDNPRLVSEKHEMPPIFAYPKSSFVRLSTGMMQGILHYTSSLAHVAFLFSSSSMIKSYLKAQCPGAEYKVSQMCSSDDSATIISILHKAEASEESKMRDRLWGESISHALAKFCTFYCFTNSEKSNMGAPDHIEFNSEFVIGNTLAMPVLKWTLACFGVTESESFLLRYNTMYNLMSQANSAGLPARNTTMVQIGQGLLAYRLIGSSTSTHFSAYYQYIRKLPEPRYGYFIIDNVYVPGMLGYGFHHWANSRACGLYKIKLRSVIDGTLGFTPEGGIMENFLLRHGRSQRYLKMIASMGEGASIEQLRDYINTRATCLYQPSTCSEDARVKLIAKALLPGTAQSLSKGNPFLQALSSSVYCLHTYCFTKHESSLMGAEKESVRSKISLLGELWVKLNEPPALSGEVLENSEATAFPNHELYKTYAAILEPYKTSRIKRVRPMRYKKTSMFIPHATSAIGIPLYDLCKDRWIGIKHKHSLRLAERCWLEYKKLMPWLSDTLQETLEKSPFSDHMELHNFVSTASKQHRKFVRVGPSIRSTFVESQVSLVARRTAQEGVILSLDSSKLRDMRTMRARRGPVSLALEIPQTEARLEALKKLVADSPIEERELKGLRDQNRRAAILNIILAKMSGLPDSRITELVLDLGGGLVSSWMSEQEKEVYYEGGKYRTKWTGPGEVILCNADVTMKVQVMDGTVTSIFTSSARETRKCFFALKNFLTSHHFTEADKISAATLYYTTKEIKMEGPGTPIHETRDDSLQKTPSLDHIKYSITQTQGEIRLRQTGWTGMDFTVLAYRVMSHELNPLPDSEVEQYLWSAWMNQSRFHRDAATLFIQDAYNRVMADLNSAAGESYKEAKRLKDFISNTLTARLRTKGYLAGSSKGGEKKLSGDEESSSSDISLISGSAFEQGLAFINCLDTMKTDVQEIVTLAMQSQIAYHSQEFDENSGLESAIDVVDPEEGTLTKPPCEVHFGLFTGTTTVVEYTTARLTNQYSILPLWDELITEITELNPRSWASLSRGEEIPGVHISRELIYFLTGLTKPSGTRQMTKKVDLEMSYYSKKAVYDSAAAETSRARSTQSGVYSLKFLKWRLGDMLEKKDELEKLSRAEIVQQAIAYANEVQLGSDEEAELDIELPTTPVSPGVGVAEKWVATTVGEMAPPGPMIVTRDVDANIRSLLTSDEMDHLYRIARWRLNGHHWFEDLYGMIVQASGVDRPQRSWASVTEEENQPFVVREAALYPLFLGSVEPGAVGHWVCAVSCPKENRILLFDGLNSGVTTEIERQIKNLLPGVQRNQIHPVKIPLQPRNTCGHVCMLSAIFYMMERPPVQYDLSGLRLWVTSCLLTGDISHYMS
ncbi:RdRp [Narangue virus]|uniref:RNA-directed RNA polymerase L n=1 Tax=Narangue virus TaxID=2689367 RepID=A0A6B9KGY5_9VIRU|nr:RdRp [Narangue virus]QHA33858.1 RdRp [Narangue virus]